MTGEVTSRATTLKGTSLYRDLPGCILFNVPRNAEVIRQWSILRDLESSRRMTIDDLAERTGVTTRTIRRDLEALQSAGFPLFDEQIDGKRYWMLEARAFRRLDDTGFTIAELSALYFSRAL